MYGKERLWVGRPCCLEIHAQGKISGRLALQPRLESGVEIQVRNLNLRVRSMYVICEAMDLDEFM